MSELSEPYPDPIVPSRDDPTAVDVDGVEHNYDGWIGRYAYIDGDPEPVGTIVEVFHDIGTERPEWLALGAARRLVPIAGTTIGGRYDDLYLGFPLDQINDAPQMPVGRPLDVAEEQALYAYYGFVWEDPVPVPLPTRFDDGWDTNWVHPQPQADPTGLEPRMSRFRPAVTEPPPPDPPPPPLPDTVTITIIDTQVRVDVVGAQPNVRYSIDWGDGRSPATGQTNTAGEAFAQHNYNDPGTFTITVTNRDDNDSLIGVEDVTVPAP